MSSSNVSRSSGDAHDEDAPDTIAATEHEIDEVESRQDESATCMITSYDQLNSQLDLQNLLYNGKNDPLFNGKSISVCPCKQKDFVMKLYKPIECHSSYLVQLKRLVPQTTTYDGCCQLTMGRGASILYQKLLTHPNIEKIHAGRVVVSPAMATHVLCSSAPRIVPAFLEARRDSHPLSSKLKSGPSVPLKNCIYQIVHAVAYMHKHGFVHGQVSPCNVLVSNIKKFTYPVLGGLNNIQHLGYMSHKLCTGAFKNSVPWGELMDAPELSRAQFNQTPVSSLTEKVDIWNLGMFVYLMVFGELSPLCTETECDKFKSARKNLEKVSETLRAAQDPDPSVMRMSAEYGKHAGEMAQLISLLYSGVIVDLQHRIKTHLTSRHGDIGSNGWLHFVYRCLQVNPKDRPSAISLLEDAFFHECTVSVDTNYVCEPQAELFPNITLLLASLPGKSRKMFMYQCEQFYKAEDNYFESSATTRLAISRFLADRFMRNIHRYPSTYIPTHLNKSVISMLAHRAASRLFFDIKHLNREEFIEIDRKVWDPSSRMSTEMYQTIYDLEVLILVAISNDFKTIL